MQQGVGKCLEGHWQMTSTQPPAVAERANLLGVAFKGRSARAPHARTRRTPIRSQTSKRAGYDGDGYLHRVLVIQVQDLGPTLVYMKFTASRGALLLSIHVPGKRSGSGSGSVRLRFRSTAGAASPVQ